MTLLYVVKNLIQSTRKLYMFECRWGSGINNLWKQKYINRAYLLTKSDITRNYVDYRYNSFRAEWFV